MNDAPAGLLAAAILFWGQQAGWLALAVPAAGLLEGFRLTARRWKLERQDFSRVSDLSSVLFMGMAAYLYFREPANQAFMKLSAWLPLAFLPLMAAQLYSADGLVDVRALFVFMRKAPAEPRWSVDLSYPFVILCLLSAGAANERTPVFFAGALVLTSWALWRARPPSGSRLAWCGLLSCAAALGFAGQAGLHALQAGLERSAANLLFGGPEARVEAEESRTAMGHIGRLMLSDAIVLRVERPANAPPPGLLRAAAYNFYSASTWRAWEAPFSDLTPAAAGPAGTRLVEDVRGGEGTLALPAGAFFAAGLPGRLSVSRLGTVRLEQGPSVVELEAAFSGARRDGPPDRRDLQVPPEERAALGAIARRLGLRSADPKGSVARLLGYFSREFRYSLYRGGADPGPGALDEFLLKTRAGHCEHFATAAALLLRAAGIPARYAAGFSVSEYSALERAFVARGRHAHAWVLVWEDGAWVDADPTPASWTTAEAGRAPLWEPVEDLVSWALNRLKRRRWPGAGGAARPSAWWLLLLIAPAAWLSRGRLAATRRARTGERAAPRPGSDSEWYELERALAARGLGRRSWETAAAWLDRLESLPGAPAETAPLRAALLLHNRLRFDPRGLPAPERARLREAARAYLASTMSNSSSGSRLSE